MPNILFHDFDRYNIPNFCSLVEGNVGIELGVATGLYSHVLVGSGIFKEFYGVDRYSDHHDTQEYLRALKHVGLRENYKLIRESFDNALTLFDDQYFDYIYIDGYAHTGQDGQKTLTDWWPKLKVNGIFAGDDYHSDFPLTMAAVEDFALQANTQLNVTAAAAKSKWDQYPSWFLRN